MSALRVRFLRAPRRTEIDDAAALGPGGSGTDRARASLQTAIDYYALPDVRASFFRAPEPISPTTKEREQLDDGGKVIDLAWPSAFEPSWDALRTDYLAWEGNRRGVVRAYLHPQPASTAIVCLHGYQGGNFFVSERAFQARWLYSLGLDVVLFTLPFHGARGKDGAPSWPSPHPARTNEGFAHAIYDLRALAAWLRARPGAEQQRVGAVGMSLGGTTASLWATVEKLDFMAAMIIHAAWAELLWWHGKGRAERDRAEREGISEELLIQSLSITAPLARTPLTDPERVLVLSSIGDRSAPPGMGQLARHFGGVHVTLPGGPSCCSSDVALRSRRSRNGSHCSG